MPGTIITQKKLSGNSLFYGIATIFHFVDTVDKVELYRAEICKKMYNFLENK